MGDNNKDVDEVVYDDDGGFAGYEETTVDPGPWLLVGTTLFCFGVMLIGVPLMVSYTKRRRKNRQQDPSASELLVEAKEPVDTSLWSILTFNEETQNILKLAIPYTISALAESSFANICLILVSQNIGTKAVAAYALVHVLVGLTDGMLQGPIYACTALCAQAVGAGNTILAGNYIQLAVLFYLLLNIPVVFFWWFYMYEVVLYLEWGDDTTALMAQEFIRVYIWSVILGGISTSIWQLLEATDHAVAGTIISIVWGATNFVVVAAIVLTHEASLQEVGLAYVGISALFICLALGLSQWRGWLKPFNKGIFGTLAITNMSAVKLMAEQAVPLALGSLLSNAEWAVLTLFASHLGPAEVAAWAILGSIWEVLNSVTAGIGDAAEIRVSYHLGDNHPSMAKFSAYESLVLGMSVASVVSIIFFSMQHRIPVWFTQDETLQGMLAELVPFVGIANLTMTFGMLCWSLIGAQGKYKLATWISFISSWGICMPLSALYVFAFNIDLQGLTSAVVLGYVSTGASLSYILLSSDWNAVAQKIQEQNEGTDDDLDEELYASLKPNSHAAKALARRNVRLITLPPGQRSGLLLGNRYNRPGTYVLMVRNWSPLQGSVKPGDSILALNGVELRGEGPLKISGRLKKARMFERHLSVSAPTVTQEAPDPEGELQQLAED